MKSNDLLLFLFLFNFLSQLSKIHLSFLSCYSVFAKFFRTPFENIVLFFLFFLVSLCAQEQVEKTLVKLDAVQCGLVRFILICLQFLTNLCLAEIA